MGLPLGAQARTPLVGDIDLRTDLRKSHLIGPGDPVQVPLGLEGEGGGRPRVPACANRDGTITTRPMHGCRGGVPLPGVFEGPTSWRHQPQRQVGLGAPNCAVPVSQDAVGIPLRDGWFVGSPLLEPQVLRKQTKSAELIPSPVIGLPPRLSTRSGWWPVRMTIAVRETSRQGRKAMLAS